MIDFDSSEFDSVSGSMMDLDTPDSPDSECVSTGPQVVPNSDRPSPFLTVHQVSRTTQATGSRHLISINVNMTFTIDPSTLYTFEPQNMTISTGLHSDRLEVAFKPFNPTAFFKFPHLSTELRLDIWELALSDRRFIEIRSTNQLCPECCSCEFTHPDAETWRPICSQPIPPLLLVSREARKVALPLYAAIWGDERGSKPVYCDFTKDVFCLSSCYLNLSVDEFFDELVRNTNQKIKYLVVERPLWDSHSDGGVWEWETRNDHLREYLDLKELMIVSDGEIEIHKIIDFREYEKLRDTPPSDVEIVIREIESRHHEWKSPRVMLGEIIKRN